VIAPVLVAPGHDYVISLEPEFITMRVVIDSNVWVSALINPNGTPAKNIHHPATFEVLT
jgi:hypothetical protein